MKGSGHFKMIFCAIFRSGYLRHSHHTATDLCYIQSLFQNITDRISSICRRDNKAVRNRGTEIISITKVFQSGTKGTYRSDICRIAVGIPPGSIDNGKRFIKIVISIRPSHDHDGMIGDNMAISAEWDITIFFGNLIIGVIPVRILFCPVADIPMYLSNNRIRRDKCNRLIKNFVDILFYKSNTDHCCDNLSRINGFAIMGDSGGFPGKFHRQFRLTGRNHAERIDKYLRTDLF